MNLRAALPLLVLLAAAPLAAQSLPATPPAVGSDAASAPRVVELPDGTILAADPFGTYTFASWTEYLASPYFLRNGKRCGQRSLPLGAPSSTLDGPSDCSSSITDPNALPAYAPGGPVYRIPVVFHVIQSNNGNGALSDALVHSQVDILNEDFRAQGGTNGAGGVDTGIEFYLATVDPNGNPTTGIRRYTNRRWYNDRGGYDRQINWDTSRYLNIYTNTAGGNLGYAYVPNGGGVVGQYFDGVRLLWSAVGRDAPGGPPYDQGRTATHEVGHYLGLYHTFQGGCHDPNLGYTQGDLIADTNPESSPNYSACARITCSSPDPVQNYMDYSEDLCMNQFSAEQAARMRCTIENWRPDLVGAGGPVNSPPTLALTSPANGTTVPSGTSVMLAATAQDSEDGNLTSSIEWTSDLDGPLGTGTGLSVVLSIGTHEVTARVTDSAGASTSSSVTVDVTPGGTGGGITNLRATTSRRQGRTTVDLSWDAPSLSSFDVLRNGAVVAQVGGTTSWTDPNLYQGHGSIQYRVTAAGDPSVTSGTLTVNY